MSALRQFLFDSIKLCLVDLSNLEIEASVGDVAFEFHALQIDLGLPSNDTVAVPFDQHPYSLAQSWFHVQNCLHWISNLFIVEQTRVWQRVLVKFGLIQQVLAYWKQILGRHFRRSVAWVANMRQLHPAIALVDL